MLDRRGHDIDEDEDNDRNCEHDRFGILPSVLFDRSKIIKNRASDQNRSYKKVMIRFGGSYLLDWIFLILLGVILSIVDKLDGFQREFDLTDPSIRFPHALTERVPMSLLIVLSVIVPLALIILINLLTVRSGWDLHTGLLGLGLSLCLTLVTTVIVKVTVGRPRPDFLARCQPLVSEIISNSSNVANSLSLSNASICTANRETREFKDGFKSFPSGHSSAAWSGLGYLSLYMAGKFHVFDRNHLKIYSTIKLWVSIAPIFAATLIAISRTMDYRHHWEDVLIGSLIGLGFSYLSYRNYYYPLSSKQSHRPYSPRSSSSSSSTKAQLPIALRSSLLNKSNDDNEDKRRMVGDEEQGCRAESVSPEELIYHGNYRFENVRSSRILNNGSNESMTSINSGANDRTSNDSSLKEAQGSRGYRYINKTDK
ncbi:phosphatidic acid phosphatase type 2/haloperoxidase [Phakopsora pachyrhizi]|uniref:Phosphatidic acid phosphatase type 2/haloperoxidase n=1 Tax=Phakopsora pachyrhizi TaxID=170000 RepID=A0AAV0AM67_PHAPC|nr:phosphatidic acid phosphatase type 2/haloperoxidase [Phakopsora pachyrhizi]